MSTPTKKPTTGKKTGRKPKLKEADRSYLGDRTRRAQAKSPKRTRTRSTHRIQHAGASASKHPNRGKVGVAEFIDRICDERDIEIFSELPESEQHEISELAEARWQAHNDDPLADLVEEAAQRLRAPRPKTKPRIVRRYVELAAMRRTPAAIAIREVLSRVCTGPPTDRSLVIAIFELMSYGRVQPEILSALENLTSDSAVMQHVFDDVREADCSQDEPTVYKVFARMLKRFRGEHGVLIDENLKMIQELAAAHPKIGRHCSIDGTIIPAAVDQSPAPGGSAAEQARRRGKDVGFMMRSKKVARGWYCVTIVDVATGLPLIWKHFPGQEMKLDHVLELVQDLQARWPECPIETLIGDGEYAGSLDLAYDLEFSHGIHPVFPKNPVIAPYTKWTESQGVPKHCGKPMTWVRAKAFQTRSIREANGLTPGEESSNVQARTMWSCPCGYTTAVYVKDDPQFHTFYPRSGSSLQAIKRRALEGSRCWSETAFSQLKRRGKGLAGSTKAMWMDEIWEAEWHIGACLMSLTMARYIHETGRYEAALEEMSELLGERASRS